ncbi:LPD29 domain-containing protein [Hydrogenophaga sp. SNF1]|uniref:LPD29 domain-containing protein n=1 Tax=Hydrogenophaga sp. SNF1 TaxID=3098762 RepID=UPI002ACC3224|nr:LPD29 domain-containing protein [Hydrogenophaga sp. SNF1]WQB84877.1 LPD29 domain-containing protein [Hydrogenophaga sp. SNF1]
MQYLSCADTAKLVRQALKEAFPGIKFSVRSSTYSGGASIRVGWIDGPNAAQVEAVAKVFEGAYFDGMQDYKGSLSALVDGVVTSFGADYIFCERGNSDAAVQRAIDSVYRRLQGNFEERGIAKPTLAEYRSGNLCNVAITTSGWDAYWNLQSWITRTVVKASDRLAVAKSKTAGKVIQLGGDGYGQGGTLQVAEVA